jgi:hypothetical protein
VPEACTLASTATSTTSLFTRRTEYYHCHSLPPNIACLRAEKPDSARYYNVSRVHQFPYIRNGTNERGKPWSDASTVALLELSTDIVFDEWAQPVCLASSDRLLLQPDSDAWMAGWISHVAPSMYSKENITQLHLGAGRLAVDRVPTRYASAETRDDIVR